MHWNTEGVLGIALRRLHPLARDLKAGHVASVQGSVSKRVGVDLDPLVAGQGSAAFRIWVVNRELGNQEFWSSQDVYETVPESGMVRLYYLPRSRWAVNVERVADKPVDGSSDGREQTLPQSQNGWWRRAAGVRGARRKARLHADRAGGKRPNR